MKFKDNLRRERTRANLSQEILAEKMSVSRQTISKWENGDTYPNTKHILALAKILNSDINKLINNESATQQTTNPNTTSHKKHLCLITNTLAAFFIIIFGFVFVNLTTKDNAIINSKIAVFDQILIGSLDDAIKAEGYTEKQIIGYGITEADQTFYVKCNLYDNAGNPCSAIIYFCKNDNGYFYKCQYLDNLNYTPKGEYYEIG